ncbi:MAG: sulfur carrier protein ThiS adenylyltransferase ThiF [Bacteroidetes bacterium]|nr:sulfur carrier protein ThiS adenylyltransferase ThiF [Bacteroidota bacterium]
MKFDEISRILSLKTVGIAGCGGLGSNCAVALARCGLGNLIIADYDIVDESNLNRQYFFREHLGQKKVLALKEVISRINPSCRIETHDIRLKPIDILRLFSSCDIIVEAFDDPVEKMMLIETWLVEYPDKPVVSASGLAGFGHIDDLRVEKHGKLFVCGDQIAEASEDNPPLAPRVNIVANMQADTVLELLVKPMKS